MALKPVLLGGAIGLVVAFSGLLCPDNSRAQEVSQHSNYSVVTHRSLWALGQPSKRVVFGQEPFSTSTQVPFWDKDFLVTQDSEVSSASVPNVRIYDDSGTVVRQGSVRLPGAMRVGLIDSTVTEDGRIVASGVAIKEDGTRAYFIARTDLKGVTTNVIQTNPFHPRNICSAPDGTVWGFGGVSSENSAQPGSEALLRQFDFERGLVKSFLTASSFAKSSRPAYRFGKGAVYFRCFSDGLAAYSEVANEYIEMNFKTGALQRYQVKPTPLGIAMNGFAITNAGEAFGLFTSVDGKVAKRGLFHLVKDESGMVISWEPVEVDPGAPSVDRLLGTDGKSLIYMDADEGFAFFWSTPHVREGAD